MIARGPAVPSRQGDDSISRSGNSGGVGKGDANRMCGAPSFPLVRMLRGGIGGGAYRSPALINRAR